MNSRKPCLIDQTDPDSGLVFVCSDSGTEVYRPTPFEKLKDLPAGKKVIPQPDAKRFLVVSNTKLSLYDYDFNLMHEIEGKFDPKDIHIDNLHAVGSVSDQKALRIGGGTESKDAANPKRANLMPISPS